MAKTRVPVAGTIGKSIKTISTVPPQNLTITQAQLQAIIAAVNASQLAANPSGLQPTIWNLVGEIPQNIVDIAALVSNGFLVRNPDGSWSLVPPPPPGQPGIEGEPGVDGERGPPGASGAAGAAGALGPRGFDGEDGETQYFVLPSNNASAGAVGANPTGLIGMSAVNGSALTFNRSDSTHAIDPAISPTWTNGHTFTKTTSVMADGPVLVSNTVPYMVWDNTGGGTNNRYWAFRVNGLHFQGQVFNDASGANVSWVDVTRAASTIADISLGNASNNPTFNFLGTGAGTVAGPWAFTANGSSSTYTAGLIAATPLLFWNATGAGVDSGHWQQFVSGSTYQLRTINDAVSSTSQVFTFTRAATAITDMSFGSTDNPTYSFLGTGTTTLGGRAVVHGSSASDTLTLNTTAAGGMFMVVQRSGVNKFYFGDSSQLDGGTLDDLTIRSANNIGLSPGAGARMITITTSKIDFGVTGNVPFNFLGTGTATFNGHIVESASTPVLSMQDTGANGARLDISATNTKTTLNFSANIVSVPGAIQMLGTDVIGISTARNVTVAAPASGDALSVAGQISVSTIGKGLSIAAGTNAKLGTATINSVGVVTVANTSVTANSRIFLQYTSGSGSVTALTLGAVVPGTSFSVNGAAFDTFNYLIVEAI